ncbi:hypothetical protein DRQ32_09850 [bacterium]|nr:MAG: hypothetical protein DRQ32_09850 [bacterium]
MLMPSILALVVLSAPAGVDPPRGTFDSIVPRLPGGYGSGPVSIRVHTVPLPESASPALVSDLISRTGTVFTETQGVRIEIVLPKDVDFESLQARVIDGLVLEPQRRSLIGHLGNALVSLLRILLVGQLVTATNDLAISGAAWAVALGAPNAEKELIRLSTSETLFVDREAATFSDHSGFVICRSMLAFSPWTELVNIELRCTDRTTGKEELFIIPRLALHHNATPNSDQSTSWDLVMHTGW